MNNTFYIGCKGALYKVDDIGTYLNFYIYDNCLKEQYYFSTSYSNILSNFHVPSTLACEMFHDFLLEDQKKIVKHELSKYHLETEDYYV